jgi:histidinol-phosphate/aromatic aminotransferase/cobyric acid decarboxylase-like protein
VRALADPAYYELRWKETVVLRAQLADGLRAAMTGCVTGGAVTEAVANFVLMTLPAGGLSAAEAVARCRAEGVYLRDVSGLSPAFEGRTVRSAVRGGAENERIAAAVHSALQAG